VRRYPTIGWSLLAADVGCFTWPVSNGEEWNHPRWVGLLNLFAFFGGGMLFLVLVAPTIVWGRFRRNA
jgi:hypothetical protein